MQNPGSVLAQVPQGEFNSRYADPKNHAASGSMISFVSGGKLIPGPNSCGLVGGIVSVVGQAVRGEEQGSEWERIQPYGITRRGTPRDNSVKVGVVATSVSVYKKLVKKVCTPFQLFAISQLTSVVERALHDGCEHAISRGDDGCQQCMPDLKADSLPRSLTYDTIKPGARNRCPFLRSLCRSSDIGLC
jgi:hypothetical protein